MEELAKFFIDKYSALLVRARKVHKAVVPSVTAIANKDEGHASKTGMPLQESIIKMEITAMPELLVRSAEDSGAIMQGKLKVYPPKFKPTDWAKIEIRFIDDRNVIITTDKKEQIVADYQSLIFADGKRNKPNTAWKFLRGLASTGGSTGTLPTPIPDTIKQHKRHLSDGLKKIFKNDTDPFYDSTDTHVYRIKINLIPPQKEAEPTDELGLEEYRSETMTEVYIPEEKWDPSKR